MGDILLKKSLWLSLRVWNNIWQLSSRVDLFGDMFTPTLFMQRRWGLATVDPIFYTSTYTPHHETRTWVERRFMDIRLGTQWTHNESLIIVPPFWLAAQSRFFSWLCLRTDTCRFVCFTYVAASSKCLLHLKWKQGKHNAESDLAIARCDLRDSGGLPTKKKNSLSDAPP